MTRHADLPPAIVVGGGSNALSIARSLGQRGVRIYILNEPGSLVRHSRFCTWLDPGGDDLAQSDRTTLWSNYLLGPQMERFRGAVLLAASDSALMVVAQHRADLAQRFVLDLCHPEAQLKMLNKLETYEIARDAGVATPLFWNVRSWEEVMAFRDELVFPLLVKPCFSHLFEARFAKKFFVVTNLNELQAAFQAVVAAEIDILLMELIPGPDSLLCSYYTFLDERGEALFDFTKRVIRRNPIGMGGGCLHITDRVPDVRDSALKVFREAALCGVANAEFKQDPRTGQLKLIECNARFTAANCLVMDAGIDLAYFVYARAVGLPPPPIDSFRSGLTLWDPIQDFFAFRELRRRGELSLVDWIVSILRCHTLPYFKWNDSVPSLVGLGRELSHILRSRMSRLGILRGRPQAVGTDKSANLKSSA